LNGTIRGPRLRALAPVAALLALLLALAGCGGSSSGGTAAASSSGSAGSFPVTVTGTNGAKVTLAKKPTSIVSMSATATEMLFAIGAGSQVKAVDSTSNYPTDVPKTDLSAFTPNAEAIVGYHPDLVVLSNDINGIVAALGKLDVPTLLLGAPKNIDGSYQQIEALGEATGHADKAAGVVDDMRNRIKKAIASVPHTVQGEKVYHEEDPTGYSATSSTFIGSVYEQFGLKNIADAAPGASTSGAVQLSAEYIVSSSPDLIVLADTRCCGVTRAGVASRPGWNTIAAVRKGAIAVVDDSIASRWGPRLVNFVNAVSSALKSTQK
jgi:iron complex transport system substrate-binding protein